MNLTALLIGGLLGLGLLTGSYFGGRYQQREADVREIATKDAAISQRDGRLTEQSRLLTQCSQATMAMERARDAAEKRRGEAQAQLDAKRRTEAPKIAALEAALAAERARPKGGQALTCEQAAERVRRGLLQ